MTAWQKKICILKIHYPNGFYRVIIKRRMRSAKIGKKKVLSAKKNLL